MDNLWMLLLAPLGILALAEAFDNDDDTPPDPEPEPDEDDELAADDLDGVLDGGAGNDQISSVRETPGAHFFNETWVIQRDDGSYDGWNPDNPIPSGGLIPGMTALLGGEGEDSITASGPSTHIDGGAGDDVLSLHSGDIDGLRISQYSTVLRGGDGNDSITVTGSHAHVSGGDGDDLLIVSGERISVSGGAGADLLDVTGLRGSNVFIGSGDTLIGRGEDDDTLHISLAENVDFTGNATAEYYTALGDSRIDGGAGNDTLTTFEFRTGSATLLGGAGDDLVWGNRDDEATSAHSSFFEWHTGDSNDVLDGGAGNDQISFDLSDTVTGGAGADTLQGWVQMDHTAVVTDFNPAEDKMFIQFDPRQSTLGEDAFGHVSVVEQDGNTLVHVQNQEVLRIEGATGLRIGYDIGDMFTPVYVDANGNPADENDLDLILNRFEDFTP